MPNYGLSNSAHSGTNAWDVNLNSSYGDNANAILYSPYFNCASANFIDLSFWYYSEVYWSDDGVRLEVSTDDGISWNIVDASSSIHSNNWYNTMNLPASSLPAWTGRSGYWLKTSIVGINVTGVSRVLYRFIFNSNASINGEGFTLDDFSIRPTSSTNLECSLLSPTNLIFSGQGLPILDLNVQIANVGNSAITGAI